MAAEVRQSVASSHESAGQFLEAINVLRPLADAGDQTASSKIQELTPLASSAGQQPVTDAFTRRP